MVELGMFQDERVELIRGVLVKMPPQLPPHASTVQKLTRLLIERLQDRFSLRSQSPLALSDDSEPEPDFAVVALGNYEAQHPSTALLVIEVADTATLKKDRAKAAVYASSGIGEYWIVNLDARAVEVYSSPDGDRYAEGRRLRVGETVQLVDVTIAVAEILPKV